MLLKSFVTCYTSYKQLSSNQLLFLLSYEDAANMQLVTLHRHHKTSPSHDKKNYIWLQLYV